MNDTYYEILYNSDRTEGRGPIVSLGMYFYKLHDAMNFVTNEKNIDKYGVQGRQSFKIMMVSKTNTDDGKGFTLRKEEVWGYRETPDGNWGYGLTDLSDFNYDQEYKEYLRLKDRFEN